MAFVALVVLLDLASLPIGYRYIEGLRALDTGELPWSDIIAREQQHVWTAVAWLVAFVIAGVMTTAWLYRITKNAKALRPGEIEHNPKWAVWGWFVPFLNLVRPHQMMKQAWVTSRPDGVVSRFSPKALTWWWGAMIVTNVTVRFVSTDDGATVDRRQRELIASGVTPASPWGEVPQMPTDFTPVLPTNNTGIIS